MIAEWARLTFVRGIAVVENALSGVSFSVAKPRVALTWNSRASI